MEHGAKVGLDDDRRWLRDRMGHVHELNVERSYGTPLAERHDVERKVRQDSGLGELRLEHGGGEGRGIDRHPAKARPKVDHGTEMIFVRVGQQQALQVRALSLEE